MNELKKDAILIRKGILKTLSVIKQGHIGGAMSMVEILACLYGKVMKYDPAKPDWDGRDYLVISKGHCGPAIYACLSLKGYFDESELTTINQGGTNLPSHCDMNKTTGIDMTTGSLGQGLSLGAGLALGHKLKKMDNKTFVILGDGELNEGQNYEAIMFSAHNKLSNLTAIVDLNKKQLDGWTKDIIDVKDYGKVFESFSWHVIKVDGHDIKQLLDAFEEAGKVDKPVCIIADTVKGKGCPFVVNKENNHHIAFTEEEMNETLELLDEELKKLS